MTEWSSEEMRRLQEEAKKRVLEMKDRSKFATDDMNKTIFSSDKTNSSLFINSGRVKNIKMPVEYDKIQSGNNKNSKTNPAEKAKTESEKPQPENSSELSNDIKGKLLGNLSDEELEKLFVLSLCLLLGYEQADEELILALLYIIG